MLLLLLALCAGWDALGLDLAVARLSGDSHGFPLRDHWVTATLLYRWAKLASILVALWILVGLRWPTGVLRSLTTLQRGWLLATSLSAMLLVSALKYASASSCPWDVASFGGAAHLLPHWMLFTSDGGPGHCFPAGHASAGFGWIAGYFAFRRTHPRIAVAWAALAVVAGFVLGISQQLRGAHFASHTLWTAWVCLAWAAACSRFLPRVKAEARPYASISDGKLASGAQF